MEPGAPSTPSSAACGSEGALDSKALEQALAALVERHESLRTVFLLADGEPAQRALRLGSRWSARMSPRLDGIPRGTGPELAGSFSRRPFELSRGASIPRAAHLAERGGAPAGARGAPHLRGRLVHEGAAGATWWPSTPLLAPGVPCPSRRCLPVRGLRRLGAAPARRGCLGSAAGLLGEEARRAAPAVGPAGGPPTAAPALGSRAHASLRAALRARRRTAGPRAQMGRDALHLAAHRLQGRARALREAGRRPRGHAHRSPERPGDAGADWLLPQHARPPNWISPGWLPSGRRSRA